jgi:two-component system response regulator (stage 0 sporulation protein A)
MEKKIIEKLLEIGVLPHTKGFGYLKRAIEMTIKNKCKLPEMTKDVYPKIAEENNDTCARVERACRHARSKAKAPFNSISNGQFVARVSLEISLLN